jgi:hypothetical protein
MAHPMASQSKASVGRRLRALGASAGKSHGSSSMAMRSGGLKKDLGKNAGRAIKKFYADGGYVDGGAVGDSATPNPGRPGKKGGATTNIVIAIPPSGGPQGGPPMMPPPGGMPPPGAGMPPPRPPMPPPPAGGAPGAGGPPPSIPPAALAALGGGAPPGLPPGLGAGAPMAPPMRPPIGARPYKRGGSVKFADGGKVVKPIKPGHSASSPMAQQSQKGDDYKRIMDEMDDINRPFQAPKGGFARGGNTPVYDETIRAEKKRVARTGDLLGSNPMGDTDAEVEEAERASEKAKYKSGGAVKAQAGGVMPARGPAVQRSRATGRPVVEPPRNAMVEVSPRAARNIRVAKRPVPAAGPAAPPPRPAGPPIPARRPMAPPPAAAAPPIFKKGGSAKRAKGGAVYSGNAGETLSIPAHQKLADEGGRGVKGYAKGGAAKYAKGGAIYSGDGQSGTYDKNRRVAGGGTGVGRIEASLHRCALARPQPQYAGALADRHPRGAVVGSLQPARG